MVMPGFAAHLFNKRLFVGSERVVLGAVANGLKPGRDFATPRMCFQKSRNGPWAAPIKHGADVRCAHFVR